jgi:hypothetical protein
MTPGKKPGPRVIEPFPAACACSRPGCPNRARYEITDDGWATAGQVCHSCFLHWNGTLPLKAKLAQVTE